LLFCVKSLITDVAHTIYNVSIRNDGHDGQTMNL
jgi:hypothetical protein